MSLSIVSLIKTILTAKKDVKKDRVRRSDTTDVVNATVEVAIFTEHLLFRQYCDKFSPSDTSCTEGINELSDYVSTLVLGVSPCLKTPLYTSHDIILVCPCMVKGP